MPVTTLAHFVEIIPLPAPTRQARLEAELAIATLEFSPRERYSLEIRTPATSDPAGGTFASYGAGPYESGSLNKRTTHGPSRPHRRKLRSSGFQVPHGRTGIHEQPRHHSGHPARPNLGERPAATPPKCISWRPGNWRGEPDAIWCIRSLRICAPGPHSLLLYIPRSKPRRRSCALVRGSANRTPPPWPVPSHWTPFLE